LGSRVDVQVSRVDLDGRRIDFRLVTDGELAPARGASGKTKVKGKEVDAGAEAPRSRKARPASPPKSGPTAPVKKADRAPRAKTSAGGKTKKARR
jgi:ribonuclease R